MPVKPEMTPADVRRLLNRDNAVILEIGANDGTDTAGFLEAFPQGHVYCWECDPRAIAGWRARIGDNPRATLYECALSDRIGTATFHQSDGQPPGDAWKGVEHWDKSGSLLPVDKHQRWSPWLRFEATITVPTSTLDEWFRVSPITQIDFAWVDVQGAEAMVLRGGQQAIQATRFWYCECDPRPNYKGQAALAEICGLLPGFRLVAEHGGYNYLFRNDRMRGVV